MTRFFIFLISYGLLVMSTAQIIIYLNYRTLGHTWDAVLYYIVRTPDFAILVISAVTMIIIVSFRGPLRLPFSSG
ncbi:Uncharacterised protein [Sporosarcina pasteurii]|uniref:Uncharacterized protein n=1 Tax=Sporosarcina pasteurii TaxID=1474 RepID=A0A380BDX3_SPOPA|nr:Uncharacterised protein [Sporosarcina pasteurii]